MIEFLLYTLFFLSALLLVRVILLQEGKGGGLSDAFGGGGAQTFGVRSGGINKFTFTLFAVFIMSAMALHWTGGDLDSGSVMSTDPAANAPGTAPISAPAVPAPVVPASN